MKSFIFLLLSCSFLLAQDTVDGHLNLSAEQKAKMKVYQEEMKACQEKIDLKILSILDNDQKIKFLQMKQGHKDSGSKHKNIYLQKVNITD